MAVETPVTHYHHEKSQVYVSAITTDDHHKESQNEINLPTRGEDSDSGKATSPQSTRSNNVSIESLDDGSDSSLADSDSDFEDSNPNVIFENIRGINNVNNNTSGIIVLNEGQPVVTGIHSENSAIKPQIGSIAVQNSSDITFGNKTFYQGPVTIKQFLLENDKWKLKSESGNTNDGYEQFDGDITPDATSSSPKRDIPPDQVPKKEHRFNRCLRSPKAVATSAVLAITFLLVIVILCTATDFFSIINGGDKPGDGDDSRINIPIPSLIDLEWPEFEEDPLATSTTVSPENPFRIISRSEWHAKPSATELPDLITPALRVIIAHTVTPTCNEERSCINRVRSIQDYHMFQLGFDDIGYNFLVASDGAAYEGTGWNKGGSHTRGYNSDSICIAFIGDFMRMSPIDRQLDAAKHLIEECARQEKLIVDYKLYGHRQLSTSTVSPGDDLTLVGGSSLRIVSRLQWVAQPPSNDLNNLELPSERVIIAHTATESCVTQSACVYHVRYIQTFHIESQGWDDIGYNFLVGGDGAVYEGRGWDKEGAHTRGFNKKSICIAFIGLFNTKEPPNRQIRAALMLMDEGVRQKKLISDYKIFAHRQLIPSESPGLALYNIIRTWKKWSNDTSSLVIN